jgi:predicted negative regulator of RcsB-dependent stress response
VHYSRQELKQDKFAESAAEAVHWGGAHLMPIVVAVVAVIVVLGGWWYFGYYSDQAASELGKATVIFNAPVIPEVPAGSSIVSFKSEKERTLAAKDAFYAVSNKYGLTASGQFAHYYAGLCEIELENYKVAEDQLKSVANARNKELASMARFALASVYRSTNRGNDAIAIYKGLIDTPTNGIPKVLAQLELADVYSSTDPAKAKSLYEAIAKDDAKGAGGQIAQQRLADLK